MDYSRVTIDSYDRTFLAYEKNTKKLVPVKEAKYLASLLRKNGKILDLGCGTGRDSEYFSSFGFYVVGIDLSNKMLDLAGKRCKKAKFKKMDIRNPKFKGNSFDAVWANASLLHVKKKDIPKTLGNIRKILRKDGILFISVKKGSGEKIELDKRYGNFQKFWSFFTKSELESTLKRNGFRIIKSEIVRYEHEYMTRPWIRIFLTPKQ